MDSYPQVLQAQEIFTPGFHGDGSGFKIDQEELRTTGQTINLAQLLECCSSRVGHIEFKVELWLHSLNEEIKRGAMQCLKPPGPGCEYGLYRFDATHPFNIPGTPEYEAAVASNNFSDTAKQQEGRAHQGRSFW
jgi:hypothetical protein